MVRRMVQNANILLFTTMLFVLLCTSCTDRQPLPPVSLPQSLPRSIKEYVLYSWNLGGEWRFTLITGTNRLKTLAEITSPESVTAGDWVKITVEGTPDLKSVLERLPPGTKVFWRGPRHPGMDTSMLGSRLRIPPERLIKEIRLHCAELDIQLDISR